MSGTFRAYEGHVRQLVNGHRLNHKRKTHQNSQLNRCHVKKQKLNYFASSNPHPPHSRAFGRKHGSVNSSMVFEWPGAYDCSTSFALRALSTCLRVKLHLSASRSRELNHRFRARSTGKPLWRDTRRDPLASRSGGILGGIHWRAALAGYWVGAWCRSIANADTNIKSNNPFLSGGEKLQNNKHRHI